MLWIRKVYDWTLAWAESAYASLALFFLALIEASFFIIPPDLLLMALCAGKPKKSFWFATICALGSLVGGAIGYVIGLFLMDTAGVLILDTLHLHEAFKVVQVKYDEKLLWQSLQRHSLLFPIKYLQWLPVPLVFHSLYLSWHLQ